MKLGGRFDSRLIANTNILDFNYLRTGLPILLTGETCDETVHMCHHQTHGEHVSCYIDGTVIVL